MGSLEGTFDTKLHEAVRYGDIEDVRVALHHGYDPNLIGLYQWSALHEAANNGELEILQLLLKHKGMYCMNLHDCMICFRFYYAFLCRN